MNENQVYLRAEFCLLLFIQICSLNVIDLLSFCSTYSFTLKLCWRAKVKLKLSLLTYLRHESFSVYLNSKLSMLNWASSCLATRCVVFSLKYSSTLSSDILFSVLVAFDAWSRSHLMKLIVRYIFIRMYKGFRSKTPLLLLRCQSPSAPEKVIVQMLHF